VAFIRPLITFIVAAGIFALAESLLLLSVTAPMVYWVAGSIASILLFFRYRRPNGLLISFGSAISLVALLVLFAGLDPSGEKSFLRMTRSIRPGMTRVKVRALMEPYVPGTTWPKNPFAPLENLQRDIFQVPGGDNGDWFVVIYSNDTVVKNHFSHD
jgi:hypothetical protein